MPIFKSKKRRERERRQERQRVIDFIINHAAKKDFIDWLNANYNQQFLEDADWEKLRKEVKNNSDINNSALHNYAGTLTDQEDVTKLLKDVEKETEKAEETVSKLYDTANAKRLRPIIGGACMLGGFLLLIVAVGFFTGIIEIGLVEKTATYIGSISAIYGLLTSFAGLLLILE